MDTQPDPAIPPAPISEPRRQAWFAPTMVALMSAQLVLLWVQGGLLHRQHQEIQDLREDIQGLAETLESSDASDFGSEGDLAPSRHLRHGHPRLQRVRRLQENPEATPTPTPTGASDETALKDIEASRASAKKAISDARDVQSKLSIEENIRKADEKSKIERAEHQWQKWIWAALGLGLVAMVVRGWLRRRG